MEYHFRLPKEFATKWIAALRSGEYIQGKSYLFARHTDGITSVDKHCCLGVACSISGIPNNELKTEFIKYNWEVPSILKGDRGDNPFVRWLTDLNDGKVENGQKDSKTFAEISDLIEKEVEFI